MTASFEELLNSTEMLKKGDRVRGTIYRIDADKAYVDVKGAQYDCVILKNQVSRKFVQEIAEVLSVGQEVETIVTGVRIDREKREEEVPGIIYLSRKAIENQEYKKLLELNWEEIIEKFEKGEFVNAEISALTKGGLISNLKGIRAFVPASLIDTKFTKNLSNHLNKEYTFKIEVVDKSKGRIILNRKVILEEEKTKKLDKIFSEINVGDVLEGKVRRITNFGVFVNIGEIDGLVHISEISHTRFENITDVLNIGDTVKVIVIDLDRENVKVALSIKALLPTQWEIARANISVGDALEGKVRNITDFGVFVEVASGVEGLVHISQISHERVEKVSNVLKQDDIVKVKVLDVDFDKERLSLSIKALQEKPVKVEDKEEEFDTTYLKTEDTEYSLADKFNVLQ
ncbi:MULTISPECIES: 30S ribosomal protein S1 [unclassified Gemella]|uniref:30S ribosomal protein S1 n=1 Tax=unclassified Gemella TaxID=2624949 RepID=UPI001C05ADA6|nr:MULTISPECIES: 30S ribosomal protein S1 [unclassified Gemella]MBU0278485.1 30S ribosomal protein S1 [Gemella sp. zg-1178]QWQ39474.1 30S ribosomal protein S1 [Gemella sp. zg-570]